MKEENFRLVGLIAFSILLGGLSLIAWKFPIQIIVPEFYETYFVPANGHPFAYLLLVWFLVGGYKTGLIMAWDMNENYFQSLSYRLKAVLFVPLAPITNFKSTWYKLPSVEYMNNK